MAFSRRYDPANCNFQKLVRESTGSYRFVTGFYGPTVMLTEFQKILVALFAKFVECMCFSMTFQ